MENLHNDIRTLQYITKNIEKVFNPDSSIKETDIALYQISYFVRQMLVEKETMAIQIEEEDNKRAMQDSNNDIVNLCNDLWTARENI
jgi:hypothetical protein